MSSPPMSGSMLTSTKNITYLIGGGSPAPMQWGEGQGELKFNYLSMGTQTSFQKAHVFGWGELSMYSTSQPCSAKTPVNNPPSPHLHLQLPMETVGAEHRQGQLHSTLPMTKPHVFHHIQKTPAETRANVNLVKMEHRDCLPSYGHCHLAWMHMWEIKHVKKPSAATTTTNISIIVLFLSLFLFLFYFFF